MYGAYTSMDLIGLYTIVLLSLTALATGLLLALGTQWGLFRHYWVLMKLLLAMLATYALLMHQFTAVAEAAKRIPKRAQMMPMSRNAPNGEAPDQTEGIRTGGPACGRECHKQAGYFVLAAEEETHDSFRSDWKWHHGVDRS